MGSAGWKRKLVVVAVGVVVGVGGLAGRPADARDEGGRRERRCGDCYYEQPSRECGRGAPCNRCDQGRGCSDCYRDRPCGGADRPPPCRSCGGERSCGDRPDGRSSCGDRQRPAPCRSCGNERSCGERDDQRACGRPDRPAPCKDCYYDSPPRDSTSEGPESCYEGDDRQPCGERDRKAPARDCDEKARRDSCGDTKDCSDDDSRCGDRRGDCDRQDRGGKDRRGGCDRDDERSGLGRLIRRIFD
jgi:hypothetical protein